MWAKANIPTKSEKAVIQLIERLLQSWTKFSANARNCTEGSPKYENFKTMLNELCDLADGDEEAVKVQMRSTKLPTWERDYMFYLNQKAGVVDRMEGVDLHAVKRQKTIAARLEDEETRKDKEKIRASQSSEAACKEAAAALDMMCDESNAKKHNQMMMIKQTQMPRYPHGRGIISGKDLILSHQIYLVKVLQRYWLQVQHGCICPQIKALLMPLKL